MFLGEEIQKHGEKGHNPIEDSVAAMKLVNLKLRKGYDFGDVLLGGYVGDEASRKSADKDEEIMLLSAITEIRDQGRRVSRGSNKSSQIFKQILTSEVRNCESGLSPRMKGRNCHNSVTTIPILIRVR